MTGSMIVSRAVAATVGAVAAASATAAALAASHSAPPAPRLVLGVEDQYPTFSPDGRWIAFESRRADGVDHIFKVRSDGGGLMRITNGLEDDEAPVFSPDGETILFARRLGEGRSAHLDIFAVDPDGGNLRNLSQTPDASDDHHKFSADGKLIVFNSSRSTPFSSLSEQDLAAYGWNYDIWVMNADGSGQRPLIELPGWDTYPSFSPDGQSLLWRRVIETADRNSEIFIATATGDQPRNLTDHPAFDGYPAFSPDGEWIAFASNRDGDGNTFRLYAMRPNGSDVRRLTDPSAGVEDVRPAWSPDGASIVFNRDEGGDSRLMIVNVAAALDR